MNFLIIALLLLISAEVTAILLFVSKKVTKKSARRKVFIDTSALIDGRILSVAQTGFISDDLVIPRSVIHELQLLADGKDTEKRRRARQGLDTVSELERVIYCDVQILQDSLDRTPVDDRLIALAKENRGSAICTLDYNLNKVAATEHIDVLNVNDLATVLRSEYLPGQHLNIKITGTGSNPGQGVGHLPDGTMVVVDNASKFVGKEVEIEIIRFLQTSAGRMMFTRRIQPRRSAKSKARR